MNALWDRCLLSWLHISEFVKSIPLKLNGNIEKYCQCNGPSKNLLLST